MENNNLETQNDELKNVENQTEAPADEAVVAQEEVVNEETPAPVEEVVNEEATNEETSAPVEETVNEEVDKPE